MINFDVIIVGGGPAGSTCAWKLRQYNIAAAILDKDTFPRPKVCAGWISPKVLQDLHIDADSYPHSITPFSRLVYFFRGVKVPVKTRQYAIRRIEFDHWLLQRAGVEVAQHRARKIRRENGFYIIDDQYRCRYLVGAGGTHCPVYNALFLHSHARRRNLLIAAVEEEVPFQYHDSTCYLWFFDNNLPGYAWYVPKRGGYINIGIGGRLSTLKKKGETILWHWGRFLEMLKKRSLIHDVFFHPKGHTYYLRHPQSPAQIDNAYLIGDAAGLATVDMGEGIGPAIESGLLAAEGIAEGKPYSPKAISRYSLRRILFPGKKNAW